MSKKAQSKKAESGEKVEGLDYSRDSKRRPNYRFGSVKFHVECNGKNNAPTRKFIPTGIEYVAKYDDGVMFEGIDKALADGKEVRIGDTEGGIRIFPCLEKDLKTVTVVAQSYGWLRTKFRNKNWAVTNSGKFTADELVQKTKDSGKYFGLITKARKLGVTPDLMVTCPKCGTEFRVGKTLV